MKYLVYVNAKFMVSIEANSALSAEHKALDLEGIDRALAFDADMMKTETFRACLMDSETISFEELEMITEAYHYEREDLEHLEADIKATEYHLEQLRKDIKTAREVVEGREKALAVRKPY